MAKLSVLSDNILMDDNANVTISNLDPFQKVTLTAHMKEDKQSYFSHAHYIADKEGIIRTATSSSVGGDYKGVQPSGLFWSMQPVGVEDYSTRLRIKDVTAPYVTHIRVLSNYQTLTDIPDVTSSLCSCIIKRSYMADHVIRTPIRVGRIRGMLFIPYNGSQRCPGVVDLFGTVGGITEYRACLLASRGFCSLSLAFFNYEDLPKDMGNLDLSYFEEAVNFLSDHQNVTAGGVGIIGVSKGADLAIYTSIVSKNIKAVVPISCLHANVYTRLFYHDKTYEATMLDFDKIMYGPKGEHIYSKAFFEAENIDDFVIPIEEARHVQFCFIHGTGDIMNNCLSPLILAKRLKDSGQHNFQIHMYQGAGHLIEPPHSPLCKSSYHKVFGCTMMFGGDSAEAHAHAQEDHWHRIQTFLRKNLGNNNTISSHL